MRQVHDAHFHFTLTVFLVWVGTRKLGPVYVSGKLLHKVSLGQNLHTVGRLITVAERMNDC